jgi:hypothetical protein
MAKKNTAFVRDDDLDHRPFGDSHFGNTGRDRRRLEKPRAAAGDAGRDPRSKRNGTTEPPAPSPHLWHEGFFEELDSRSAKRSTRKQGERRGKTAVET